MFIHMKNTIINSDHIIKIEIIKDSTGYHIVATLDTEQETVLYEDKDKDLVNKVYKILYEHLTANESVAEDTIKHRLNEMSFRESLKQAQNAV